MTTAPQAGNVWVDFSNTCEDGGLGSQPYHLERYARRMGLYSYDRRAPGGAYVEGSGTVFNAAIHPNYRAKELDR